MGSTIPWAGGVGLYTETSQAWVYEETLPVSWAPFFPTVSVAVLFCSIKFLLFIGSFTAAYKHSVLVLTQTNKRNPSKVSPMATTSTLGSPVLLNLQLTRTGFVLHHPLARLLLWWSTASFLTNPTVMSLARLGLIYISFSKLPKQDCFLCP